MQLNKKAIDFIKECLCKGYSFKKIDRELKKNKIECDLTMTLKNNPGQFSDMVFKRRVKNVEM